MGNNSVPKYIFRLSRFPVYRGSVLGRFYCICKLNDGHNLSKFFILSLQYLMKLHLLSHRCIVKTFITLKQLKFVEIKEKTFLRCVIPVVLSNNKNKLKVHMYIVTNTTIFLILPLLLLSNEREENVVKQHN